MQSNQIGEKNALFWIAWAFVTEKVQNFKMTDQIFQKGIRKLAEPRDLLQKRYQQFQRRLARHYLNNAEPLVASATESDAHKRQALGVLSKQQVRSGIRVVDSENAGPGGLPQRGERVQGGLGLGLNNGVKPPSSNQTNEVHIDKQPAIELAENPSWKSYVPNKQQSKENAGEVYTLEWCVDLKTDNTLLLYRCTHEMERSST
jgi:hypothetical protein